MNEKNVIDIIRHYRHDLLNDLQIIHGYSSMGRLENVKEKLAECMHRFHEERKLTSLDTPSFALWLIRFNSLHTNFRLTYHIDTNSNLQGHDRKLLEQCGLCIEIINKFAKETELYEGNLQIIDQTAAIINLQIAVAGQFPEIDKLKDALEGMEQYYSTAVQIEENGGISCTFYISDDEMNR